MKRLEEALQVIRALWTERPANFAGRYYRVDQAMENPAPIQRPHPPIMIGGSGEKVTLRLVAKYGQMCNVSGDPDTVRHRLGVLRDHCERIGRPYDEITRSNFVTVIIGKDETEVVEKRERLGDFIPANGALVGTPAQLIDAFRRYAQAGVQYSIFRTPDWIGLDSIRLFAEAVIPALADD